MEICENIILDKPVEIDERDSYSDQYLYLTSGHLRTKLDDKCSIRYDTIEEFDVDSKDKCD